VIVERRAKASDARLGLDRQHDSGCSAVDLLAAVAISCRRESRPRSVRCRW
jgi:hypothetical protein